MVAGREILKTIRVTHDQCVEEFDLRSAVVNHAAGSHLPAPALAAKHKDQLAAKDVKWSHAEYDRVIATAAANGRVVVYDLARPGLELGRFQEHSRQVHRLAFNPHRAAWLLSGSQDATIRMWDLRMLSGDRGAKTFGSKHRFNGHSEAVRDIRWSPVDGVEFATATDSGAIQRWDVRKENAPLLKINAHEKSCSAVDWHSDGKHLVSGSVDRQVKVWDFSSTDRRQKPAFQLRTPQAVSNVRWRPPSWSGEAQDTEKGGDWRSTQLATSYEQDDPRIHLWDLRRPHIPYREFDHYARPATDMLWRSNELLWTVTGEGAFTQTDFNLAPQVIRRRKPCSIAWSPDGNVAAFTHKRQDRRKRSISFGPAELLGTEAGKATSTSGEKSLISQSWTDESLEGSPLGTAMRKRPGKATHMRGSKSLSGTPPTAEDSAQIVSLEKAVAGGSAAGERRQNGIIGHVSGSSFDAETFKYLAQHYAPMTNFHDSMPSVSVQDFLDFFDENAIQAEKVSLHRLAQTWRILGYAVGLEISAAVTERATNQENRMQQKGQPDTDKPSSPKEKAHPSKAKSLLFKGVVEWEGQKRTSAPASGNASSVTTPLAQPLPDSPKNTTDKSDTRSGGLKNGVSGIQQLPPSVLTSCSTAYSDSEPRYGDSDGAHISDASIQPSQLHQSGRPDTLHSSSSFPAATQEREPASKEFLADGQRSAPRTIAGRAGWRPRDDDGGREETGFLDEDYDQRLEDKRAALRDFKACPRKVLTLDPPNQTNVQPPAAVTFARHDSADSFPMFSASTDSSQPTKSLVESYSPLTRPEAPRSENNNKNNNNNAWSETMESPLEDIPELDIGSSPVSYQKRKNNAPTEDTSFSEELSAGTSSNVHLERPSRPLPFLAETLEPPDWQTTTRAFGSKKSNDLGGQSTPMSNEGTALPISPSQEEDKPWCAQTIMRESIRHYTSNSTVDIVSATHILHKMHVLFNSCDEILPYEEREAIFKTYHEVLLKHGMHVEAAEFRLLCTAAYPSVYDYAQKDSFINVFCFECNKPYENPTRDNKHCHRCGIAQPPCTICMSLDPPVEWTAAFTPASHTATSENYHDATASSGSSPTGSLKNITANPFTRGSAPDPTDFSAATHGAADDTAPSEHDGMMMHRPHGSALWSWCQGCGHGAHTACLATWLNDVALSEGGCATPGCLHDCGPGPRREQNRAAKLEANKRARGAVPGRKAAAVAKRDPAVAGESRAVERVRGMLGVAAAGAAGAAGVAGTNAGQSAASGVTSPKKVRLVTPGEEEDGQ